MILESITVRVKTGRIGNVVRFGSHKLPAPPYVVLKTERDAFGRGRVLRVITHMLPGQQSDLEQYVFDDLSDLLSGYTGETDDGVTYSVELTQECGDIVTGNDDGTISMERVFLLPGLLF